MAGKRTAVQPNLQWSESPKDLKACAGIKWRDRAALKRAGFSDEDIFDIAEVAGFYNMTNRLAAAIDMRPNREYYGMGR